MQSAIAELLVYIKYVSYLALCHFNERFNRISVLCCWHAIFTSNSRFVMSRLLAHLSSVN